MDLLYRRQVLVADADAAVCEQVAELLDQCIVDWAMTFARADRKLRENHYDLVLLDVEGVRGLELLARHGERFRVVLLAARPDARELRRGTPERARLLLPKTELPRLARHAARVLASA